MPREMFPHGSKEYKMVNYLFRLQRGAKVKRSKLIEIGTGALYSKLLKDRLIKEEGDESNPLVTPTEKIYTMYGIFVDFEE